MWPRSSADQCGTPLPDRGSHDPRSDRVGTETTYAPQETFRISQSRDLRGGQESLIVYYHQQCRKLGTLTMVSEMSGGFFLFPSLSTRLSAVPLSPARATGHRGSDRGSLAAIWRSIFALVCAESHVFFHFCRTLVEVAMSQVRRSHDTVKAVRELLGIRLGPIMPFLCPLLISFFFTRRSCMTLSSQCSRRSRNRWPQCPAFASATRPLPCASGSSTTIGTRTSLI